MLSDATLQYAEVMTSGLLAVDRLLRREDGAEDDGLVVLNMAADRLPAPWHTYAEAEEGLHELLRLAADLPEPDRRQYYQQLCGSTIALLAWRQGALGFADQISRFLHVPPEPVSDAEMDALQAEMHALLAGMGYDGGLQAQAQAWEHRNRVPPDEVEGTLGALMDAAWDRTAARIELPAPRSDGMQVRTVTGVPFNARCDYLRRTVELNRDPVLTYQALKHLATHECYPGHYVQFKLRETWYREGTAPADGLLSIVNSASSSPFEGIADNGIHVIDWIESDDDRVGELLRHYGSALATAAAWNMHTRGWSEDQTRTWLAERALVGGEAGAGHRVRFFAAPQRSVLIWSYWWGDRAVTPVWQRQPPERREAFVRYLYGRMHSVQTVRMFDAVRGGRAT